MNARDPDPVTSCPFIFVGDLEDPWVVSIANALPAQTLKVNVSGNLPETVFQIIINSEPSVFIVHRMLLTPHDAEWLSRLKSILPNPPRVVLCFGVHTRSADLERWLGLVDIAIPEATARDTIGRQLTLLGPGLGLRQESPTASRAKLRMTVVSTNLALRQMLAETCEEAGYHVATARDWSDATAGGVGLWDVPVLDSNWPRELTHRLEMDPVLALMGFADRDLVAKARSCGVTACLPLPLELADLIFVLDRLPIIRGEPAHRLPPPPGRGRRAIATASKTVVDPRWKH